MPTASPRSQASKARTPRAQVLRLAILNLLSAGPIHGYALRKHLSNSLGPLRTLSYGSLYPALRKLEAEGLIASTEEEPEPGRLRRRITHAITAKGRQHLDSELSAAGPADWEDGAFDLRFQMFSGTNTATRLRILEGRQARMRERSAALEQWALAAAKQNDPYVGELIAHAREQVAGELAWLRAVIDRERGLTIRGTAAPSQ